VVSFSKSRDGHSGSHVEKRRSPAEAVRTCQSILRGEAPEHYYDDAAQNNTINRASLGDNLLYNFSTID